MPVTLTVSEVRDALYRGEVADFRRAGVGRPAGGDPTTAMLGQWFHAGLTFLVTNDSPESPLALLADVEADPHVWKETLARQLYTQFVGPRLTKERAALHESAHQVLTFWQAMQNACAWTAGLCWSLRSEAASRRTPMAAPWRVLADCFQTDQDLRCELREPGWPDSVRLVGKADAVVRRADIGAWCVVEFKSGQTSPLADAGQVCLYHLILSALESSHGLATTPPGTLALISFTPELHETLFTDAELADAQQRLLAAIGEMAGVDRPAASQGQGRGTGGVSGAPSSPQHHSAKGAQSDETQLDAGRVHRVRPLDRSRGIVADERYLEMGNQIVTTLAEYGVGITLDGPIIAGPTFVRFPVVLGRKTRVAAVENRAPELQMRLGLREEPFISRDQGRLVIDVQRPERQTVYFDTIRAQLPAPEAKPGCAAVPVGVDLDGQLVCADLSRPEHAHLLVAGTTGSGKSEWLRVAIAGLIAANTPGTLRLLIIDPKRNAFHALRDSPFLWRPLVFPDEHPTGGILEQLCEEMDARYRRLEGADTIADLVAGPDERWPRIVCVCDEYRDLISRSPQERKQIEAQIFRLGSKARAAGIHLILATQQPNRETIKGALDSNIPARIGLKTSRHLESNMLLGEAGAEKLLGAGDLLFKDIGAPRRLQAPLLTAENRREIFGAD
jgi:hypothetical protein